MPLRLGLMGGAFNPPHFGHLRPTRAAADFLALDKVLFIPSGQHPLKNPVDLAPAKDRSAMTQLAIADEPRFELSRLEVDRQGTSYTIETLKEVRSQEPQAEIFFLMGADLFEELHLWREWRNLLDWAHIHVSMRPGFAPALKNSTAAQALADKKVERPEELVLDAQGKGRWIARESTLLEISSTELRAQFKQGIEPSQLVPPPVLEYIARQQLYQR